ncbi:MAG TPA: PhzF family phenazine biosynthesis protein [Planctomycetota bacterium]|nr:PhzF family phenazine biosynthesis protein [Planctomycetota bacterium]
MKLPLFQVDAFASQPFRGNPAAIVPLRAPLPDTLLQDIAAENNLSETAYVRLDAGSGTLQSPWPLRWFTPATEVDLCGHATLAAAWVLFHEGLASGASAHFGCASGTLGVRRDSAGPFRADELLHLDFPSRPPRPLEDRALVAALAGALGAVPREAHVARDALLVFDSEATVLGLRPDMARLAALDLFGVIVTAPSRGCDFVSRFFAPRKGVPEDPVTGSSHCTLTPFWAARLQRTRLQARQVSARGGELVCELRGQRVSIGGRVAPYLRGEIEVGGG